MNSKNNLEELEREFLNELSILARKYPELEGRFGLTSPLKAADSLIIAANDQTNTLTRRRRCVAWGQDPVTGHRICIRYS